MKKFLLLTIVLTIFNTFIYSQAPIITQQSYGSTACVGTEVSIKIVASGPNLTYTWYRDGNPLGGQNSSELYFASLASSDNGQYYCKVSNSEGYVNSDIIFINATIAAPSAGTITTQHDVVCSGTNNTLSSANLQGDAYSISWYKDGTFLAQGANYTITNANTNNAGAYYYIATNSCGSYTSSNVNISVMTLATITTEPTTQTVCETQNATFSVQATGDNLNYKWYRNNLFLENQYSPTLTIENLTYPHNHIYHVEVYNACRSVNSASVNIVVNKKADIIGQPLPQTVCAGEPVDLSTYATSSTTLSYQWATVSEGNIENAQTNSLQLSELSQDTAYYYCLITNACGIKSTDTVLVVRNNPPTMIRQPEGDTICVGSDKSLIIKAGGTETLNYQWQFNGTVIFAGNISGNNTPTLSIDNITQGQAGHYICKVSNMCGTIYSDTAKIIVLTPPVIQSQPQSATLCEGGVINLNVEYLGSRPATVKWYREGAQIATTNNYQVNYATTANNGQYYCKISNACGEVQSNTVTISVKALPRVTQVFTNQSVCLGSTFSITVEAQGEPPLSYLWYRNASPISSQTQSTLLIVNAQPNNEGVYNCKISNSCGYITTSSFNLSVDNALHITQQPMPTTTLCEFEKLKLQISASGACVKKWYLNNEFLTSTEQDSLVINSIPANMSGTYYCIAENACSQLRTNDAVVNVFVAPIINLGADKDLCEGETVVLEPNTSETYPQYNWNNGFSNQPSISVSETGTYILEVIGSNMCKNIDTINVTVHVRHNIIFDDSDVITSCGPYTLDAGSGAYSYVWSNNNLTGSSQEITETGRYSVTVEGDSYGCTSSKTVDIIIYEPISFSLGADVVMTINSFVNIGIPDNYPYYLWSNGHNEHQLTVKGSDYGIGEHCFWLKARAANMCEHTDTICINILPADNVENFSKDIFVALYPNPASNYLNIEIEQDLIKSIIIFDVNAKYLWSETLNVERASIDISSLSSGNYFLVIQTKTNRNIIKKFEKNERN